MKQVVPLDARVGKQKESKVEVQASGVISNFKFGIAIRKLATVKEAERKHQILFCQTAKKLIYCLIQLIIFSVFHRLCVLNFPLRLVKTF